MLQLALGILALTSIAQDFTHAAPQIPLGQISLGQSAALVSDGKLAACGNDREQDDLQKIDCAALAALVRTDGGRARAALAELRRRIRLQKHRREAAIAVASLRQRALPLLRELLASSRTRPTARIVVRRLDLDVLERLWAGPEARPPAAANTLLGRALARHPVETLDSVARLAAEPGSPGRVLVLHALAARGTKAASLAPILHKAGPGEGVPERIAWLRAVARCDPKAATSALVEALDAADPAVRLCAESELVRSGQSVVPALKQRIETEQGRRLLRVARERAVGESVAVSMARAVEARRSACLHAARALARLPGAKAVVAPWLHDGDLELRATALFVLGSLGSSAQDQASRIETIAREEDEGVARLAIWALGELGLADAVAVEVLGPSLRSDSAIRRAAAVAALGRSRGSAVRGRLADALRDADDRVVAAAILAMARVAPRDSRLPETIVRRLASEESAIRPAVRRVFARSHEGLLEPYIAYVRDGDDARRLGALRALSIAVDLDPRRARRLVVLLGEPNDAPRQRVLPILTRLGPRCVTALEELRPLLESKPQVVAAAAQVIAAIGPAARSLRSDLETSLENAGAGSARALRAALARVDPYGGQRAQVEAAIREGEPGARAAAMRRVGKLADPSFEALLVKCLADERPLIRITACDALARLRPRGAQSALALVDCFRDPLPAVRIRASLALSRMRADAIPALLAALAEDELEVRRFATITLERLGAYAAPARERLQAMLLDPDEELRQSANLALDAIGDR